jgi:hypothetical protein
MRLWLVALAVVALVTFVVINPVARLRLDATCGCGVRPSGIWIGALASTSIWAEARTIAYLCRPPPKRTRKQHVSPDPKKDTA